MSYRVERLGHACLKNLDEPVEICRILGPYMIQSGSGRLQGNVALRERFRPHVAGCSQEDLYEVGITCARP
jgi:hypothetical protein